MPISRRRFLGSVASASVGALAAGPGLAGRSDLRAEGRPNSGIGIDSGRLRAQLEQLSVFGRPQGGTFADGVSRVAYSDADVEGRRYVMELMRSAELVPRIDPAGNIFARAEGAEPALKPIVVGSHIDSVPNGGNFDGDLGSLAAIEVVRVLRQHGITTRHPLEVVVWAHEEGATYGNGLNGSRAVAGELGANELDAVWNGVRKADALRKIGGDPDRIGEARREPGWTHCYLELHIEQGGTLDRRRIPIGVVEGIVAIERHRVTITGVANHAGTTAMADRHDALVAASQVVLAVRDIVTATEGRQVGTVGQLDVVPNAANVVPGEVRLMIELRDLSARTIANLADSIKGRVQHIARDTATQIEMEKTGHYAGALATPDVQAAIERAASGLGLEHVRLPSGAGHDAQMAARLGPMGMIFVPSVGGISHSPQELTRWEDCARGADVLLGAVVAADRLG